MINFFRGKDKTPRKKRNVITSTYNKVKKILSENKKPKLLSSGIEAPILKRDKKQIVQKTGFLSKAKKILTTPILEHKPKIVSETKYKYIPIPKTKKTNPLVIAGLGLGGTALLGATAYGGYKLGSIKKNDINEK